MPAARSRDTGVRGCSPSAVTQARKPRSLAGSTPSPPSRSSTSASGPTQASPAVDDGGGERGRCRPAPGAPAGRPPPRCGARPRRCGRRRGRTPSPAPGRAAPPRRPSGRAGPSRSASECTATDFTPSRAQAGMTAQAAGPRPATSTLSIPAVPRRVPLCVPPSGAAARRRSAPCEACPVSLAVPATPRTFRARSPGPREPGSPPTGQRPTARSRGGQRCPSEDASGAPARRAAPTTASAPTPEQAGPQRRRAPRSRSGGSGRSSRSGRSPGVAHVSTLTRSTLTWVPSSSKETVVSCTLIRSRRPTGGGSPPQRRRTSALNSCSMPNWRRHERAVLEVLGDDRAPGVVGLVVEELEDVREDVVAGVDLDRLAGARSVVAHDWLASSPAPARTKPRSRA